jgi:hypothetical protein
MTRSLFRKPSWRKSLAARTSPTRALRRALGVEYLRANGSEVRSAFQFSLKLTPTRTVLEVECAVREYALPANHW